MELYAFHGCYEEEQKVGNRFLVSVVYTCEAGDAPLWDKVDLTVSYLDVYRVVREEMEKKAHILESVAQRIVDRLLEDFSKIIDIEVKISKCNPPLGGLVEKVSVTMAGSR